MMAFFGFFGGSKDSSGSAGEKTEDKPKPCCVCKPEKAARDECMLYSKSDNPVEECKDMVVKYKECMARYGFSI